MVAKENSFLGLYFFIPLPALKYVRKRKAGLVCRLSRLWPCSREGKPQEPGFCVYAEGHSAELPPMLRRSSEKEFLVHQKKLKWQ